MARQICAILSQTYLLYVPIKNECPVISSNINTSKMCFSCSRSLVSWPGASITRSYVASEGAVREGSTEHEGGKLINTSNKYVLGGPDSGPDNRQDQHNNVLLSPHPHPGLQGQCHELSLSLDSRGHGQWPDQDGVGGQWRADHLFRHQHQAARQAAHRALGLGAQQTGDQGAGASLQVSAYVYFSV